MVMIRIIIISLVIYGSLFPFTFYHRPMNADILKAFIDTWSTESGRGDIFGNIILFIPVGFVFFGRPTPLARALGRAVAVMVSATIFAAGLQLGQFYLPGRTPALSDVVWNAAGTAVGVGSGFALWPLVARLRSSQDPLPTVPFILLLCWAALRFVPFVPSFDLQLVKDSLKPLLLDPQISLTGTAINAVSWLVVVHLVMQLGLQSIIGLRLAIIMLGTFTLKVFIVGNDVTGSNVVGAAIAWGLALFLFRRDHFPVRFLAIVVAGIITVKGLEPFQWRLSPERFTWIPFMGFLTGSLYLNVLVFLEKIFFYGSLLYLFRNIQISWVISAILTAGLLTAIEFAQIFLAGHSPEITDPLLAAILAYIWASLMRFTPPVETSSQLSKSRAMRPAKCMPE